MIGRRLPRDANRVAERGRSAEHAGSAPRARGRARKPEGTHSPLGRHRGGAPRRRSEAAEETRRRRGPPNIHKKGPGGLPANLVSLKYRISLGIFEFVDADTAVPVPPHSRLPAAGRSPAPTARLALPGKERRRQRQRWRGPRHWQRVRANREGGSGSGAGGCVRSSSELRSGFAVLSRGIPLVKASLASESVSGRTKRQGDRAEEDGSAEGLL